MNIILNFTRNSVYNLSRLSKSGKICVLVLFKRMINQLVTLSEQENKLKDLLVNFCDDYNCHHLPQEKLELRITGGWVRDKLLGGASNDLDIAINHLTGEEFAHRLHDYLIKKHPLMDLKSHVIKKNPEKSKHLETCTTKLFGMDVDFVNLRSEKYTEDSRVPVIECGTAEEDALRRDATLNALFYNLNKQKVEDFTGKGLEDLRKGILRTPLPPLQTFLDDPLRVLRLMRFASRFNFTIEEQTLAAMKNPELKIAFKTKISRERVGVELDKILTSRNPQYGLQLISYVDLIESIFLNSCDSQNIFRLRDEPVRFKIDKLLNDLQGQTQKSNILYSLLERTLLSEGFPFLSNLFGRIKDDTETRKQFWLCSIYFPIRNLTIKSNPKKAASQPLAQACIKEGLRFGKAEYETVGLVLQESARSRAKLDSFLKALSTKRSDLGLYLRNFGQYWALALFSNCFDEMLQTLTVPETTEVPTPNLDYLSSCEHPDFALILSILTKYERLLHIIEEKNLSDVDKEKPIIDGKTLSKTLGLKPGPWMGKINPKIIEWQLDNPTAPKEECIDYVKLILVDYT